MLLFIMFFVMLVYWYVVFNHVKDPGVKLIAGVIGFFIPMGFITLLITGGVYFVGSSAFKMLVAGVKLIKSN